MIFVSFQCWILWKDFWRRWWGWVPPKALSPTAHPQLTGTRWLNLWFKNKHFNVQEPILKVLQTILPDAPMAALEVFSKTTLWRIFSISLPQGGYGHWISCGALCSKLPQGSPQETKSAIHLYTKSPQVTWQPSDLNSASIESVRANRWDKVLWKPTSQFLMNRHEYGISDVNRLNTSN